MVVVGGTAVPKAITITTVVTPATDLAPITAAVAAASVKNPLPDRLSWLSISVPIPLPYSFPFTCVCPS